MADILIDRQVLQDVWQRLPEGEERPSTPGSWLYTLPQWQALGGDEALHLGPVGLWLETGQDHEALLPYLAPLQLIAIHFPSFTDGRGHSLARWLRQHAGYRGELRAVGDVFRDTVHELSRCGFNAFSPRLGENADNLKKGLDLFSDAYQLSVDRPEPLFRRRLNGSL